MRKKLLTLLLCASLTTMFAEPLIIHVTPDGSNLTTVDGLSWENAVSLTRGRALVNYYNTQTVPVETQVWAKYGQYDLTSDAFQLTIPMVIYGGFNGSETLLSQRDWKTNKTILNQTATNKGVIFSNVEADAVLDGWILQNGNRTTNGGCGSMSPGNILRNCIIRNNKTTGNCVILFSGLSTSQKKMVVENCLIINNESGASPVVTQATANSLVDIINTTMANNYCTATGAGVAIGINTATGVTLNLINSIIYGNIMSDQSMTTSVASTNATKNLFNNAWDVAPGNGTRVANILLSATPFRSSTPFVGIADASTHLFADIENADFRLVNASTCINAGNNSYVTLATDLGVNQRIQDNTVDMGCYESTPNTGLKPTFVNGLKVVGSTVILPESAIGKTVRIYNLSGIETSRFVANKNQFEINNKGVYIINVGSDIYKIMN